MSARNLSVIPVSSCSAAGIEMLISASHDPLIVDATYLPPAMDELTARAWAASRGPMTWLVHLNGVPVGFYRLSPALCTCGFAVPYDTYEREVWLIPSARGQSLIKDVTAMLRHDLLISGVGHILSVMWETNTAAITSVRRAGFRRLGRGWWEHPSYDPGWCEVWISAVVGA